jgi:hypothetical protein
LERRNFGVGRRNEIWMENERERETDRKIDEQKGLIERT